MLSKQPDSLKYNSDSIVNWIAAKERHKIPVKNKVALFIRYFGCELVNGSIRFYDDIYGDDRALTQKYFAGK
jgi:murein L,D-transpeptidase YcbB/YkuD